MLLSTAVAAAFIVGNRADCQVLYFRKEHAYLISSSFTEAFLIEIYSRNISKKEASASKGTNHKTT